MNRFFRLLSFLLIAETFLVGCSSTAFTEEDVRLLTGTWKSDAASGGVVCIQLNEDGTMVTSGFPANLLVGDGYEVGDSWDVEPSTVQWDNPIAFTGTWDFGPGIDSNLHGFGASIDGSEYAFGVNVRKKVFRGFELLQGIGDLDVNDPIVLKRSAGSCEQ